MNIDSECVYENIENYILIIIDFTYISCKSDKKIFSYYINDFATFFIFTKNVNKIFNYLHIDPQIFNKMFEIYIYIY